MLARRSGAKILLRIDDLDQVRANNLYIQDIFDTLNFLEIPRDEGPRNAKELENSYSQLHRMDMYRDALQQLADKGLVFACSCSRKQLLAAGPDNPQSCACLNQQIPLNAENVSWRLQTGIFNQLSVKDYNGKESVYILPQEMHNFVVKKKDGFPAYQLTSVVDDLFFGVDLVVRGEDLWPSTLAQHALASALGKNEFADIAFYHHPLIADSFGKKLSKSAGATSVKYLRDHGKSAAQVYQMIASVLDLSDTVDSWQSLADALKKV
jgi:glutamyl-tRNA synthetase